MKTPFTSDQFFEVLKNYNIAIFPAQVLFYIISIVAIYFVIKPTPKSSRVISVILSFFWLWMGIVYHLFFFTTINKAAYLFGGAFILQGLLFLAIGAFKNKFSFQLSWNKYGITGMILVLYALVIYPVFGYFMGHVYPASPTFGLPCPTTIFTFGLLLFSTQKCPIIILIIPFAWSIIGFTAAFKFGIIEDTGLIIAGVLTLVMMMIRNRQLPKKAVSMS